MSVEYYNANADQYVRETLHLDMEHVYARFLPLVPRGGLILDAGCGSGRDSRNFLAKGFRVVAFDGSPATAALAAQNIEQDVEVRTFNNVTEVCHYDGIWACASLLHVPEVEIVSTLTRFVTALKPGGVFYVSFKYGTGEGGRGGRHYTDATEERVRGWLSACSDICESTCWITDDVRSERSDRWLNVVIQRQTVPSKCLVTGGKDSPFLPRLGGAIGWADEIDFAVAFIKTTGLRLLLDDLFQFLGAPQANQKLSSRLRILTSDYLGITDPEALRLLMLLQERGAEVRVYKTGGTISFHLKAYIFVRNVRHRQTEGIAFIGSSNISRQALTTGLEWNYCVHYPGDTGFMESRVRFEELFRSRASVELTHAWIEEYEQRRTPPPTAIEPGSDEWEAQPKPRPLQERVLKALDQTRQLGYKRGLVVLATGLGKTWIAAFDSKWAGSKRVLFVAHREEILNQAAAIFLRTRPTAKIGEYAGRNRDREVDVLFASVQTLGRKAHLDSFPTDHFDYIVVDEFHHAAASSYQKLLQHFEPLFLLGLTATPNRTDQSDILSLCDDNLVFTYDLFDGIESGLLAPFHYYGIWDSEVDYQDIPWRNGRFDPERLSNKLATLARARHALLQWRDKGQRRTLAFCVSTRHADFMAKHFQREGVRAEAVYAGSVMHRSEALEKLGDNRLDVVFSVDLFNEGVDLPDVDTIMMLRPTESKLLFLQQLGRGLRLAPGKERLVVLDFIGNHKSFLHKPQALAKVGSSYKKLAEFARKVEEQRVELPPGCYINYDLKLIEFLKSLDSGGTTKEYEALRDTLGRRPTLTEFYRSGASFQQMRNRFGSWFELVDYAGDLDTSEKVLVEGQLAFLREIETTAMTKCFKMVLLEAFGELRGWQEPPLLNTLAARSWAVLHRRLPLLIDLPESLRTSSASSGEWLQYWLKNPVNAWTGGNKVKGESSFFRVHKDRFEPLFSLDTADVDRFCVLVQELVDFRLAQYMDRVNNRRSKPSAVVLPPLKQSEDATEIYLFPNLRIACGYFKTGTADEEECVRLPRSYGKLDLARHFIAPASGNSMNGGKNPIKHGDLLLLEHISPTSAGSITGQTMAIERQDESGDNQYLLRRVVKDQGGMYILRAQNPDYEDLPASEDMRTFARLKAIVDPIDTALGRSFLREEIPGLFGVEFNTGNWHSGHIVLEAQRAHVLLVTLNKRSKAEEHRYIDHWVDEKTFHWQTQNATSPSSKKGRQLTEHHKLGISLHLFVRDNKLLGGKAAPFTYFGKVRYKSHNGSQPMSVFLELEHISTPVGQ